LVFKTVQALNSNILVQTLDLIGKCFLYSFLFYKKQRRNKRNNKSEEEK